jgi:hypothetical protein
MQEKSVIDISIFRSIGNSISFRVALMAEIAVKLAEQDRRDAEMRQRLLLTAPEELRKWLEENMVLTYLFQHGRCHTKINFGDEYGFKDVDDTKAKIKVLSKVWKDVVRIRLGEPDGTPEPYRIEVQLSAVM